MELNEFVINLLVCFGLSFLIGIERQFRLRIIGLRTVILVSVGSFLFVSMSFLVNPTNVDVTRIASQIVCGIGFLGAGVILKDGLRVRGLTTAATLFCDAAIGTLCANGYLIEATLGTAVILFSNIVLRYLNSAINKRVHEKNIYEDYHLEINCSKKEIISIKNDVNLFIKKNSKLDFELKEMNIVNTKDKNVINIEIEIRKTQKEYLEELINSIYAKYSITELNCVKVSEEEKIEPEEM